MSAPADKGISKIAQNRCLAEAYANLSPSGDNQGVKDDITFQDLQPCIQQMKSQLVGISLALTACSSGILVIYNFICIT